MPIYEYQCTKCGEVFEAFQKITDEPLTDCKLCHSRVEKLISQSSFQLKGNGWYLTDYAKKSSSSSQDRPKTGEISDKTETKSAESKSAESESTGKSLESKA